jgi:hypothetical protein
MYRMQMDEHGPGLPGQARYGKAGQGRARQGKAMNDQGGRTKILAGSVWRR